MNTECESLLVSATVRFLVRIVVGCPRFLRSCVSSPAESINPKIEYSRKARITIQHHACLHLLVVSYNTFKILKLPSPHSKALRLVHTDRSRLARIMTNAKPATSVHRLFTTIPVRAYRPSFSVVCVCVCILFGNKIPVR